VVTICTTGFNKLKLYILPTEGIYGDMVLKINSINRFGFVAETECVSCVVRTELLYIKLYRRHSIPRVEAGSNTSIVALRVVEGDEKERQCLGL
jgi:hypothetical protein